MTKPKGHPWIFKARFRRRAFGWRSKPPIQRIKEAVAEIKKVARKNPVLAADGAVLLLEKISPAFEQVDSSSGAIGAAVNKAIAQLVPVIAKAPVDAPARCGWLKRLLAAIEADGIPYIERLGDDWGDLCGTKEIASAQADDLIDATRLVLGPDRRLHPHFYGTSACLSALFKAERYAELVELTSGDVLWDFQQWAVRALVAQGKKADAIRFAESCRDPWANDREIDRLCEEILLSSGLIEEAYERYGLSANRASTYLATFRAIAKRYPTKDASTILADLVNTTPGEEGKWFAAAKSVELYDDALALASRSPCDPRTLTRAARDFAEKQPQFAIGAGLLALRWLVEGYGYEITGADVWTAYDLTMQAATQHGDPDEIKARIREMVAAPSTSDRFVLKILGSELDIA